MRCPHCGKFVSAGIARCPSCKKPISQVKGSKSSVNQSTAYTGSSWTLFWVCLFLGYFGIHRFMEGKIKSGILWLFTGGVFGIGWIVDTVMLLYQCTRSTPVPEAPKPTSELIIESKPEPKPTPVLKPIITIESEPKLTPVLKPVIESTPEPKPKHEQPKQEYAPSGDDYLTTPVVNPIMNTNRRFVPTNHKIKAALSDYTVIRCKAVGNLEPQRKITQFSALRVRDNKIVSAYDQLINPQTDASKNPTFGECVDTILEFIGNDCIVGYNLKYDLREFNIEMQNIGRLPINNDCIDVFAETKLKVHEKTNGFELSHVRSYYGVTDIELNSTLEEAKLINYVYQCLKPHLIYNSDSQYYVDCPEWQEYNLNLHQTAERQRARTAIDCKIVSLDRDNRSAIFLGSTDEQYTTTLSACSCPDFTNRSLPCRHMYRLAAELGLVKVVGDQP